MTASSYTYEQMVAAEALIELLTSAQAILSERLARTPETDTTARSVIHAKARELHALQQSVRIEDEAGVRALLSTWGPRVRDERRFWREFGDLP